MVDADHLYAADYHWWRHHIADVARDFEGKCWSCEPGGNSTNWLKKKDADAWGVELLRCHIQGKGLDTRPGHVSGGSNSGYQAIGLAYHLGAGRIILLGFDMHNHSGKSHWFGDHPEAMPTGDPIRYAMNFNSIQPSKYGIEIYNCSRVTALTAFPRVELDALF